MEQKEQIDIAPNEESDVVIILPSGDEALATITMNASRYIEHHNELTPSHKVAYWEIESIDLHALKLWHQDFETYINVLDPKELKAIEQYLWHTYDFMPYEKQYDYDR
jgi:hypothetical protein